MTEVLKDSTGHSFFFELVDSTTGLPKTGILYTDVTLSYCRTRGVRVAITPASLASASAAYSSGGFILQDDTNQPGIVRLDVPNAAFATGVEEAIVTIKATGCRTVSRKFTLTDISMQTAKVPATIAAGDVATDAITAASVKADAVTKIQAGLSTYAGGAVASVTGAVGSVTGSVGSIATGGIVAGSFAAGAIDAAAIATDAIGSAEISAAAVTKIQSGLSTYAGGDTSGTTMLLTRIVGTLATGTHNPQSGDSFSYLSTNMGLLGANLTAADNATLAAIAALNNLSQSQVTGGTYALNSASFAFNAAMDFTTTQKAATIARVTLVDTTTTNADMRGTNNAALAATALSTVTWTGTLATNLATLASHDPGTTIGTSTYAGADTEGTTTLLSRISGSITIAGGRVAATVATGDLADISAVRAAKIDNLDAAVSDVIVDTTELLSRVVNNGYGVLADLTGIAGYPVAVDTGTAGTISFLSGEYVATTSGTFNANITQINGETVHDDGDGRFEVMDVVLDAAQPNDITFTGTVSLEPTTTDANALQLRGNGTGRALDLYSSSGHAVTMYAGLNAFDIYAQGNAIYAQSNTSDAVVLYAGGDANGLHIYGGQSSGSAVKLQANGVGCGLEVLSGGEGFAAHIGGMKIDGVVTLETGLVITQSTASTAAVQIVGNGSGPGLDIQGGEYSDGIRARSGSSYGYGFCVAGAQGGSRMWSTGANGTGLTLTGAGTGDGLFLNPGDTGSGLHVYGGSTSGDAVHVETSGTGSVYFPIDGSGITIGDVTLAAGQHVIVDSGTVTNLTNLPVAPADWLKADAVKADAVTKIQTGLATPTNITAGTITTTTNLTNAPTVGDFTAAMKTSLNSATPQNANILAIKAKSDQLAFTVANQVDANTLTGGVPEPSGARTVTITVDDGTDPLENAVVRLTSGATTWRKITDPDGLAVFSIDDATWEVSVTRGSDYTGITDTLVVADDVAETYSLDAISLTPSTPPEITAYLTAIDNNGIVQAGVEVSIQYVKPHGTGTAFDGTLRTETSDVNGLVQFTGLVAGATYRLSRGASRRHPISVHIPTDATSPYALPSIVGDS